jgi:hypothetical protein
MDALNSAFMRDSFFFLEESLARPLIAVGQRTRRSRDHSPQFVRDAVMIGNSVYIVVPPVGERGRRVERRRRVRLRRRDNCIRAGGHARRVAKIQLNVTNRCR